MSVVRNVYPSALLLVAGFLVMTTTLRMVVVANGDDDRWMVSWNAPFLASSSGYGSEATSFLVGLESALTGKRWSVAAGLAHGDSVSNDYIRGLPPELLAVLQMADDPGLFIILA